MPGTWCCRSSWRRATSPCGPPPGEAVRLVRTDTSRTLGVFLVTAGLVGVATLASIVATAGLGLISFVPFVGLAVLPLQMLAWLLRGLVFQYLGLTSAGAYLFLCESPADAPEASCGAGGSAGMTSVESLFSRVGAQLSGSAIRQMGILAAGRPDLISFAPGYPDPATFAWPAYQDIVDDLLRRARTRDAAVRADPRLRSADRRRRASAARPGHRLHVRRDRPDDGVAAGRGPGHAAVRGPG